MSRGCPSVPGGVEQPLERSAQGRLEFRYRIYSIKVQKECLGSWEGTLRWLWNLALKQRSMGLVRPHGEPCFLTAFDQSNELTALRAEVP